MKDLAALRSKVEIARESRTFVVLTVDEADALVKAADDRESTATVRCERCGHQATISIHAGSLSL